MYNAASNKFYPYLNPSTDASVSNSEILCITEDSKQRLWIGCHGMKTGLLVYSKQGIQLNPINTISIDAIQSKEVRSVVEKAQHKNPCSHSAWLVCSWKIIPTRLQL